MKEDELIDDSQSVQSDLFNGVECKTIKEYTDISENNKQYMCLWNNWYQD